mmetsp:Transcript_11234/g.19199  ORF Transcript_11234/g.19199 Transcript_11234/m.19199 type:complete len:202 (-) Transcript_11234:192-797(-)
MMHLFLFPIAFAASNLSKMSQTFPTFPYHADAKKSFEENSEESCACCNKKRGYIYNGPMFGDFDEDPSICPWCIKDGSACERLGVELVSDINSGDDSEVLELSREFSKCTPGFYSWQESVWWAHCGEPAVYHGMGGKNQIETIGGEDGLAYFRGLAEEEFGVETEEEQDEFLSNCGEDFDGTAYIFKCRKCGSCGGNIDFN